jgi:hypothetical protein
MAFREAGELSGFSWQKVDGAVIEGALARVELRPGLTVYRERESGTTQRTDKKLLVSPVGACWILVLHTSVSGGMQRSPNGAPVTFDLTNRRSSRDRVPGEDESAEVFVIVADDRSHECWQIRFHATKDGFDCS